MKLEMKRKCQLYTPREELQAEVIKLKSFIRYKTKIKAIKNLGEFSTELPLFKAKSELDYFLNPLCIVDDNGDKIYFTNEKQTTKKSNWLEYVNPDDVIAKEEGKDQYGLYTTIDGNASKTGDVYVTGNTLLYIHNNMAYQSYDFINGNKKFSIKTKRRERLDKEQLKAFITDLKKEQPKTLLQYLEILTDNHDITENTEIEAITVENKEVIETVVIKDGEVDKLVLENIPSYFDPLLDEADKIRIINVPNYLDRLLGEKKQNDYSLEEQEEDKNVYSILKNKKGHYTLYINNNKAQDFYRIGNQTLVIDSQKNKNVYSLINGKDTIEMSIQQKGNDSKNTNLLVEQIAQKQPTNMIEFLDIFKDNNILGNNQNFSIKGRVGKQMLKISVEENIKTYYLASSVAVMDMYVEANKQQPEDDLLLVEQISEKQPTNIIDFLKTFEDSNILNHNESFVANGGIGQEKSRIVMKNNELVQYIIPEEIYEQTQKSIEYTDLTEQQRRNGQIQYTKKKSS